MMYKCILYAGDTTFLTNNKSIDLLENFDKEIIDKCKGWFNLNKLIINNQKTEKIIFSLGNIDVKSANC